MIDRGRDPERWAILARAAEAEAARQAARERGDQEGVWRAERELSQLWRKFGELERVAK